MQIRKRQILFLLILIFTIGCAGGGGGAATTTLGDVVAHDQSVEMDENSEKTITLTATAKDGATLNYQLLTTPEHGILSGLASAYSYKPNTNYYGADSFTFKVNDGVLDSAIATVNITVKNVCHPLLKTGQTDIYEIGDDGYYQKGVERSYTRDDDKKVVTDNVTGLMWQDDVDAATVQKPWVTQENYDADNFYNTSGATATIYCRDLILGGLCKLETSDDC